MMTDLIYSLTEKSERSDTESEQSMTFRKKKWMSDTSGYLRKGDNRRQYIFQSELAKGKRDLSIVTPQVCLTAAISNAT